MAGWKDKNAQDRRREVREPVNIDARILPGGIPCRIVDLSPHGARIKLGQMGVLQGGCVLIEWDSGRAYQGEPVWREGTEAGLKLSRPCDLRGMVPAPFVAAKALWSKR